MEERSFAALRISPAGSRFSTPSRINRVPGTPASLTPAKRLRFESCRAYQIVRDSTGQRVIWESGAYHVWQPITLKRCPAQFQPTLAATVPANSFVHHSTGSRLLTYALPAKR